MKEIITLTTLILIQIAVLYKYFNNVSIWILLIPMYICSIIIIRAIRVRIMHRKQLKLYNRILNFKE